MSMDDEIREFHRIERREIEWFFRAFGGEEGPWEEKIAYKLFSAGIKKYGIKWSHREYKLRENSFK